MQLGFENKKQARVAIILGVVVLIVCAYELIPMFSGSPGRPRAHKPPLRLRTPRWLPRGEGG